MEHFILELTCAACPEQYDVYLKDKKVGYLRLRHGVFRCDYPDCGDETIYKAYPKGDGMFEYEERHMYLQGALAALTNKLNIDDFNYEIKSDYKFPFDFS